MSDALDATTPATRVRLDGPGGLAPLRRRVRELVAGAAPPVVVDVLLLADGLAGAACEHGTAPFEVRLFRFAAGVLRVEVTGVPPRLDLGLGARVLDSVSTRWGHTADGTLWAERDLRAISRS
ncbi:hypothetical protein [Amycolatopsis thermophila]|uniref:Uncharacterized protein n=1 Tax=Amycolatopsis thermophila TaxID=206084 RepID=A0ABU0F2U9_9PSEU|nr:hypothetical protein [Amycolatopsis thermophila]MDQ0381905.1 hypothetical protein [Amycolatopsis thermophila]